ncbi:putative lytic polysaccharide mono-oxygenase, cellulose-degrading [Lyophyllum shimeji]|uniref:Lytic polysaccharide mono-oxygenase, cellulose-degrading n=1 Tax=Lyophyllum shimeji TaxID=47721 RepID=A0A9P3UT90_LYOSH|nr:putative lytic polysaccharide mono-oxygenase, cellulose-degrading [Lyophyllum shimeji]
MFPLKSLIPSIALFATLVAGRGIVTNPPARSAGAATLAACGAGVYNILYNDVWAPIEEAAAQIDAGYNATACHLFFCRGLQYKDNAWNTRVYTPSTVVPFHVFIEDNDTGYANVSVVNLSAQQTIGAPLALWPVYANASLSPSHQLNNESERRNHSSPLSLMPTYCKILSTAASNSFLFFFLGHLTADFAVTIPDLGTQCTRPGACALQWFWYAYDHHTYESCVDFTTA